MLKKKPENVDEYISSFPKETQVLLKQVRDCILKAAPNEESISYGMPAFKLNGPLVYFAGYKEHIGFYATPSGHKAFQIELLKYKMGKGSVQFPIEEKIPLTLITKMVRYRVKENLNKSNKQ